MGQGAPNRGSVAFRLALSLAVLQWAISAWHAAQVVTINSGDPAGYYVVARNFAQGRGLTETVLWTFLAAPDTVVRPAGDYWQVGWPLALGLAMQVFGTSQPTAAWICAALSGLVPVLVFLLARAVGLGAWTAWGAGVLLCLQARLYWINVMPDVTLSYQIACLAGLLLLLRAGTVLTAGRGLMLGAILSVPLWLRGEGFLLVGTALLTLLLWRRARDAGWVLAGAGVGAVAYLAYNVAAFGRLVPAPRSRIAWLTSYSGLFDFYGDPSPATWWAQGLPAILGAVATTLGTLAVHLFLELPTVLVLMAVTGAWLLRGRREVTPLLLFIALSWLVPSMAAPHVAAPNRFVPHVAPLLCVLAAMPLVALCDAARVRKGVWVPLAACVAAACVMPNLWVLSRVTSLEPTPAYLVERPPALAPDTVVLTEDSWRVAAAFDVAAVQVPVPERGLAGVLLRYRPRYLVVKDGSWLAYCLDLVRPAPPLREVKRVGDVTWYELERR